jgi:hypothetical protein
MWYYARYYLRAASLEDLVAAMKDNPKGVRFADLYKVCEHYFGPESGLMIMEAARS